jgi:hypothetical protein
MRDANELNEYKKISARAEQDQAKLHTLELKYNSDL